MAKTIPIHNYDDMIFLDVLPELYPDFIKKVRESRQTFPHSESQTDENTTK